MGSNFKNDELFWLLFALAFIFGAIGLIGWQIYNYLRYDEWHAISVITAMRWFEIKWAISPDDWLGLYKILDYIPLSLAAIFTGILGPIAAKEQ